MNKIKITLNGIKVNDNYIPCHFSIDNLSNCVWVYARDYGRGTLPEELGTVTQEMYQKELLEAQNSLKSYEAEYQKIA